jgi:hypothetical protein
MHLRGRDGFEDLSIDGSIILKWTLQGYGERIKTGIYSAEKRRVVGFINEVTNIRAP